MIRDVKMFFFEQVHEFMLSKDYIQKNLVVKSIFFPLVIRDYVKHSFDQQLSKQMKKYTSEITELSL